MTKKQLYSISACRNTINGAPLFTIKYLKLQRKEIDTECCENRRNLLARDRVDFHNNAENFCRQGLQEK